MLFTVHWEVNDGKCGYPNIMADLSWSEIECRSYEDAIRAHAEQKEVNNLFNVSATNQIAKERLTAGVTETFLYNMLPRI